MEETKALLEDWIGKYINQEVNFRTGTKLSSAYLNELFNLLITQGDDAVKVLSNVRTYLLVYAEQSQEQSELLDTITVALETAQTSIAQAQDTATTALDNTAIIPQLTADILDVQNVATAALDNTASVPQLVIDVSNALDTANQAIVLADTIIAEGVGINDNTTSINFTWSSAKINTTLNDHDARLLGLALENIDQDVKLNTLTNNLTVQTEVLGAGVTILRTGNMCILNIENATSGADNIIGGALIPVDDRPSYNVHGICTYGSGLVGNAVISGGLVYLSNLAGGGAPSVTGLYGTIVWVVQN